MNEHIIDRGIGLLWETSLFAGYLSIGKNSEHVRLCEREFCVKSGSFYSVLKNSLIIHEENTKEMNV